MDYKIINADVIDGLKQLEDESVQCIVTSPPYFNLRDYQTASWEGGNPECDHKIPENEHDPKRGNREETSSHVIRFNKECCHLCGAKRIDNQIGLEASPQEYVKKLVDVFAECHRVLKKDGTLFLNLGDSYGSVGGDIFTGFNERYDGTGINGKQIDIGKNVRSVAQKSIFKNNKPKNLLGIPWRVAFALQDFGWTLRNEIIWCLDESTKMWAKDIDGSHVYLPIKEIKPNMSVYTMDMNHNKILVKIKNVFDNGEREALKITTKTGREIICSPEHRFVYKKQITVGGKYLKIKHKKASELALGDCLYINEDLDCDIAGNKTYDEGFVVGFYLAEGSWMKRKVGVYKDNPYSLSAQKRWGRNESSTRHTRLQFSCGITDIERGYIDYLKKYKVCVNTYDNIVHVASSDKILVNLIRDFVVGDSCDVKHLTQLAFNSGKDFLRGIMDGFMAGDGYDDKKHKRNIVGICHNQMLVDDIQMICRVLGYQTRYNYYKNKYKGVARISIRKNQKQKRVYGFITDKIESIENVGSRKVYDIEVEPIYTSFCGKGQTSNPTIEKRKELYNNLYFLGNGVWTHNCKPNVMPSSAKDRFTVDFEKVFFFTKSIRYKFNQQTEPYSDQTDIWYRKELREGKEYNSKKPYKGNTPYLKAKAQNPQESKARILESMKNSQGRNKRCVWSINTKPYKEAHFATFPEDLVIPCLLAGSDIGDTILDPFSGAATTGLVALKYNRKYIGTELNPEYVDMSTKRLEKYLHDSGKVIQSNNTFEFEGEE